MIYFILLAERVPPLGIRPYFWQTQQLLFLILCRSVGISGLEDAHSGCSTQEDGWTNLTFMDRTKKMLAQVRCLCLVMQPPLAKVLQVGAPFITAKAK